MLAVSSPEIERQWRVLNSASEEMFQVLLRLEYQRMLAGGTRLVSFDEAQFKCYSQNGEDGILLLLFSVLKSGSKRVVEIGCGDGYECNSTNLIVNHGWTGLLIDGERKNVTSARDLFQRNKRTFTYPPTVLQAWVTPENVNRILIDNKITGEIDLLSIDIDSFDYWIWNAIDCIDPRVVVVEYQTSWPADRSVTVPYPMPAAPAGVHRLHYAGASLGAWSNLARKQDTGL